MRHIAFTVFLCVSTLVGLLAAQEESVVQIPQEQSPGSQESQAVQPKQENIAASQQSQQDEPQKEHSEPTQTKPDTKEEINAPGQDQPQDEQQIQPPNKVNYKRVALACLKLANGGAAIVVGTAENVLPIFEFFQDDYNTLFDSVKTHGKFLTGIDKNRIETDKSTFYMYWSMHLTGLSAIYLGIHAIKDAWKELKTGLNKNRSAKP